MAVNSSKRDTVAKVDIVGMRAMNARILLRRIWDQPGISRADLARATGLSASTVSSIVADLAGRGLVTSKRAPASSAGGRPPVQLHFAHDAFAIVGVEIGATHVTVALTDMRGNVLAETTVRHPTQTDPAGTLDQVVASIDACRDEAGHQRPVLGLGVAVPSPVSASAPGQLSELILPAWTDIDLIEVLELRTGLPTFIENDANAGALAELWFGGGGADFTYIKVGTGIGAGHVVNGSLYRGSGGLAGELGHLSVDPAGPKCVCGNRGCLNTVAGSREVLSRAAGRTHGSTPDSIAELIGAAEDEAWARELIGDVGAQLGIGIAGLLNILNPSRIVLGGALVAAGDHLLAPLRESARSRSLLIAAADAEVTGTSLGRAAIAIGAAALALDAALDDHEIFQAASARGAA